MFLSIPTIRERIKNLEKQGYIADYVAILDREKVDKKYSCICFVILGDNGEENTNLLQAYVDSNQDIQKCYRIIRDYEYVLKIVTQSPKSLEKILKELRLCCNVERTNTYTVLSELKDSTVLNIEE